LQMCRHHSELASVVVIFGERGLIGMEHVLSLVSVAHIRVESMAYAHLWGRDVDLGFCSGHDPAVHIPHGLDPFQ
jgi:hypothetical protein